MKKIFLFLSLFFIAAASYANEDMAKGTSQYQKQNFKESVANFLKAQKNNPKDPLVNYDLGCAYYKDGQYDKALEYYNTALNGTENNNFKSSILYNMGNAAYKKGDKELSLNYYKASLKLNSSDIQTKHNIEFIQRENKKNDKENNKNQKKDKDSRQKDQENKEEQKKKENQRNDNDKNAEKKKQQEKNNDKKELQNKQDSNLLDYFDSQDKQNHDKSKNIQAVQKSKTGKNW